MVHFEAQGADDMEAVRDHEVIDGRDRACGGIFDGQDAVGAEAFFDGFEDFFESIEVEDGGEWEEVGDGLLGVGAFCAGASDDGACGEGGIFCRGSVNGFDEWGFAAEECALACFGDAEEGCEQEAEGAFVCGVCALGDAGEDFAFASGVGNWNATFAFGGGDFVGDGYAFFEKCRELIIDGINFLTNILNLFHKGPYLNLLVDYL